MRILPTIFLSFVASSSLLSVVVLDVFVELLLVVVVAFVELLLLVVELLAVEVASVLLFVVFSLLLAS